MNPIPVQAQIKLNKFKPRDYQIPICDALENKGYKKIIVVLPRRAGKDVVAFNLMIRAALKRVGSYYYIFPHATQARRAMFDNILCDGMKMLDFIPDELIKSTNIQQMKVTLKNDSQILFVGSEKYDSLRGTNPVGCVFSEAAYQHPLAYPTIKPILSNNNGWALFVSTPFGDNHFYKLFTIAKDNPDEWFPYFQTVEETRHISLEEIEHEIQTGEISEDMARQEYFCDFSIGAIGAYYSHYLNKMELNDQIGFVDWEPNYPVYTAWDLGMSDQTSILLFQVIGRQINIFDMYQKSDVGLEHYINVLQAKDYTWAKHFAPHDIQVRDFTAGGLSRLEKAAQLGFKFTVAQNMSIIDGIEAVRTTLPRIYIDTKRCAPLISALRSYRKEYNPSTKTYSAKPVHDHHSHVADALRYLCISLPKTKNNTSAEELDKRYKEAVYGINSTMPSVFRDDLPDSGNGGFHF